MLKIHAIAWIFYICSTRVISWHGFTIDLREVEARTTFSAGIVMVMFLSIFMKRLNNTARGDEAVSRTDTKPVRFP